MVLVDAAVHDRHLTPEEELIIARTKICLHGKPAIEEWLASLNLKTFGTLDEWLHRRQEAARQAASRSAK